MESKACMIKDVQIMIVVALHRLTSSICIELLPSSTCEQLCTLKFHHKYVY